MLHTVGDDTCLVGLPYKETEDDWHGQINYADRWRFEVIQDSRMRRRWTCYLQWELMWSSGTHIKSDHITSLAELAETIGVASRNRIFVKEGRATVFARDVTLVGCGRLSVLPLTFSHRIPCAWLVRCDTRLLVVSLHNRYFSAEEDTR